MKCPLSMNSNASIERYRLERLASLGVTCHVTGTRHIYS
jgi:hypothetical protein